MMTFRPIRSKFGRATLVTSCSVTFLSIALVASSMAVSAEGSSAGGSTFVLPHRVQPAKERGHGPQADILTDPRIHAQEPLQEVVNLIHDAVDRNQISGLAGIAMDHANKSIVLYWKGQLPSGLADLISSQKILVIVQTVAFSEVELVAGARALAANPPAIVEGVWTRVGPLSDFSGLQLVTSKAILPGAANGISIGGIPVRVIVSAESPAAAVGAWRWSDTPGFYGGAAIDRPVGDNYNYCTTAFPVRIQNFQEGLLTANHCGTSVDWRTPVGDEFVGRSQTGRADLDVNVITGGASYDNRIYVGPWDADYTVSRVVASTGRPAVNSLVIPSGSWSGASVVRATDVDQLVNLGGVITGPGFWAINDDGVASVGQGDSGGPTAGTYAGGTTRVTALGIISLIDRRSAGPCVGVQDPNRTCSRVSFHINVVDAAIGIGAIVKTE